MFKRSYIKFNNEQLEKVLFENRMSNIVGTTKEYKHNKPKVLFRNKTINNIINGNKNRQIREENLEAIILTEQFNNSKKKKSKKFNLNINFLREKSTLALPALSPDKFIKKNNLIKKLRINKIKKASNKKFEIIEKNRNIEDLIKKKIINDLMGSCCSVERIENKISRKNIKFNNNNNDNRFIRYKKESKKIKYNPNYINRFNFNNNYNNDINKNNKNDNKYNSYKFYSSYRLPYRFNGKNLVNEETMTYLNNNTNISNDDKNNENNKDNSKDNIFGNTQYENTFNYITSKKSFNNQFNNEPIQIKGMAQLKTLNNFNSKHYKTINI
jgi:hypothetical protein